MPEIYMLSDRAWAEIDPPLPKIYTGARRKDDRLVISGIVHVLHSFCCWQDCLSAYGPHTTIYNRFNRWSRRGLWQDIFDTLVEAIPNDTRSIDSTSIKVHHSAAGGKGGPKLRPSAVREADEPPKSMRFPTAKAGCSASA